MMTVDAAPLWIFAYGSLMWRPDFPFVERHRASLSGYHRALCIRSHHYRGTAERPGLVFGLERGLSCIGVAFEVAPDASAATLEAVRRRELITSVYREMRVLVTLNDGRPIEAVTFVADRDHEQYAGVLDEPEVLRMVTEAVGVAGANRDYVLQTQAHLLDLGIDDAPLTRLCSRLEACCPDEADRGRSGR